MGETGAHRGGSPSRPVNPAPATPRPANARPAGVRTAIMRGGSSRGLYFVADELAAAADANGLDRDELLRRLMGSPDARQIDGLGGAHPLTSKVAIVGPPTHPDADVDYLFLQLGVDTDVVSDRQNCGNLLAGIGPFALERGLVAAPDTAAAQQPGPATGSDVSECRVAIHMVNTGSVATATFPTIDGLPMYGGDTEISGVPGTAAAIRLDFADIAGSSCGALLPTGSARTTLAGVECTLVDNGMPTVVMRADAVGISGDETPADLEANSDLRALLEQIRLAAGPLMHLGDVTDTTVPKLTMVSAPRHGGTLSTRTFIPHRCHDAIGVLGAVSVATAALLPESPVHDLLGDLVGGAVVLEHPTGTFAAAVDVELVDGEITVPRAGIIRTARLLMDGVSFPRT